MASVYDTELCELTLSMRAACSLGLEEECGHQSTGVLLVGQEVLGIRSELIDCTAGSWQKST